MNQRRTRSVAIGLVVLLVLGVLATLLAVTTTSPEPGTVPNAAVPTIGPLAVTVPGDLDGDDKISDAERDEVEQTTTAAADVTTAMMGPRVAAAASSIAVTPAGQEWWDFVSSQTSFSRLWEMPAPDTNWYALTWTTRMAPTSDRRVLDHYPALHLAFRSTGEAAYWASQISTAETSLNLDFLYRGSVVTIAPAGTGLANEPLPKRLTEIKNTPQTSGYWSVDMAQQIKLTAPDSEDADIYKTFWSDLGLANAKWAAVTRDPARWVGQITGFDKERVDPVEAARVINATMTRNGDMHLGILGKTMYAHDGEWGFGPPYLAPTDMSKDVDFVFSTEIGLHSITVSDGAVNGAPIGYFEHQITGDVITITPHEAPDLGAVQLEQPVDTAFPPQGATENPIPDQAPIPEFTQQPLP